MKKGLKYASRIWVYHLVLMLIGLLFISTIQNDAVRLAINGALMLGAALLVYSEGAYNGERACTASAMVEKQIKEGRVVDESARSEGFDRKVALWIFVFAAIPFLLVSGVNAAVAPFYPEYNPVKAAEAREVGSFEFDADAGSAEPVNLVNVIARLVFMPYGGIFSMVWGNVLNALFFLFSLILPAAGAIGYLQGPRMREKKLRDIARGKKRKMRNLKVNRKPRQPKAEV